MSLPSGADVAAWQSFRHNGTVYDLGHLDPIALVYEQEAQGDKPARKYPVDAVFSSHCFTRGPLPGEQVDADLLYRPSPDLRIFDAQRYDLSHRLPAIVRGMQQRKCYHSGRGNFFVVELVRDDGTNVEYEVFFKVYRSPHRKGVLSLVVESAYVRDKDHSNRPHMKRIGFAIILHNVLNGKEVKVPK